MRDNAYKLLVCDAHRSLLCSRGAALASSLGYSAFGWRSRTMQATVLGFNGQRAEPLTGWYCLGHGHRTYDAVLMRFHSPDLLSPFGAGGLNAYVYCLADPINHEDPTGKYSAWIADMFGYLEAVLSHGENIVTGMLLRRPRGILGYARAATDIGYGGVATGFAMASAGYTAAGTVASNMGFALVSTGGSIRAAYSAIETFSTSPIGRVLRRRMQVRYAADDPLTKIVIHKPPESAVHTSLSSSSIHSGNSINYSDAPSHTNRQIRGQHPGLPDPK